MQKIKVKFLAKKGFYELGEEAILPEDIAQGLIKRKVAEIVISEEKSVEKTQPSKVKG